MDPTVTNIKEETMDVSLETTNDEILPSGSQSNNEILRGLSIDDDDENYEPAEKRMKEGGSCVWKSFTRIDKTKAKCNVCHAELKTPTGSTSALNRHFLSKHSLKTEPGVTIKDEKRKVVTPLDPESKKFKDMTRGLVLMVTKDLQPYSVVDDVGFRYFANAAEPRYQVPSRTTLSRNIIPQFYDSEVEKLRIKLENDLKDVNVITMTTDGWTSRAVINYMSLTIHYMSDDFKVEHVSLGAIHLPGRHTGENIASSLIETISKFNLEEILKDKEIFWVTDNAANMKKAINLYPQWTRIPCFAHTLQLVVNDRRKKKCKLGKTTREDRNNDVDIQDEEDDDIDRVARKAKSMTTHFSKSGIDRQVFVDMQKKLGNDNPLMLIQQVDVRWNSTYDMFERMLQVKKPLSSTLLELHLEDTFSIRDWSQIELYVQVFKPLKDATVVMSGDTYPTASSYIPIIIGLTANLEIQLMKFESQKIAKELANSVLTSMKERFKKLITMDVLVLAMITDPRYKNKLLDDETAEDAKQLLKRKIYQFEKQPNTTAECPEGSSTTSNNEQVTDLHSNSIMNFLSGMIKNTEGGEKSFERLIEDEIDKYLKSPCLVANQCPCKWWRENGVRFPRVQKVAGNYLSIPATQVSSEREFSTAGNVITATRTRLLTENVEKITFLHSNMKTND